MLKVGFVEPAEFLMPVWLQEDDSNLKPSVVPHRTTTGKYNSHSEKQSNMGQVLEEINVGHSDKEKFKGPPMQT